MSYLEVVLAVIATALAVLGIIFSIVGIYGVKIANRRLKEEVKQINEDWLSDTPRFRCELCERPLTSQDLRKPLSNCRLGEVCKPILYTRKHGRLHIPREFLYLIVVGACREGIKGEGEKWN